MTEIEWLQSATEKHYALRHAGSFSACGNSACVESRRAWMAQPQPKSKIKDQKSKIKNDGPRTPPRPVLSPETVAAANAAFADDFRADDVYPIAAESASAAARAAQKVSGFSLARQRRAKVLSRARSRRRG
jgi:hypothetical protein